MKICFLALQTNKLGGEERVLVNLASELSKEHEITIVLANSEPNALNPAYDLNPSIKLVQLPNCHYKKTIWTPWISLRIIAKLTSITLTPKVAKNVFYPHKRIDELELFLSKENYDVIIAVAIDLALLLAMTDKNKSKNKNIKYIGWFHNTYEAYFHTKGKYAYGRKRLAENILPNLDNIITLTKHDTFELKNNLNLEKCNYIYNPLSFTCNENPKFENKTLLFVGRLEAQQKGLDFLVEIAALIFKNESLKDWKLVILGDGNDRSKLEKNISKHNLSQNVICVGNQKDVVKYYLNSDILLLTSRWEGFGLVVTEAFECGIPVVAFHNNGPDEIITDGKDGYLIEKFNLDLFAEKTIALMKDEYLKKSFSPNAKESAKKFNKNEIISKWNEIL